MHFASQRGHVNTIRYLISQGADTAIKDKKGHTPKEKIKPHDPNRDEIIKLFDEKQLQGIVNRNMWSIIIHLHAWMTTKISLHEIIIQTLFCPL